MTGLFSPGSSPGPAVFPWEWEQPIGSGRWALVWKPLPVEAKLSLSEEPARSVGLRLNALGDPYFRSGDFNWSPLSELEWRERAAPRSGFLTTLLAEPEVRRSGDTLNATFELLSGPYAQLSDALYVQARLGPRAEFGSPIARYFGATPPAAEGGRLTLPIELEARASLLRGLSPPGFDAGVLSVSYTYFGIGYAGAFSSHQLFATMTWFFPG